MRDPLFPHWTAVFGFVIGAFIGSFLNMVIYRLPRGLSFGDPKRSFCPNCKHSLGWVDLMPILSWLSTGGKCRYCKEPIAVRYLVVELVTGSLFALVWIRHLSGRPEPDVLAAGVAALAVAVLVAIIWIDWELYIIPDELNATLLLLGLAYGAATGHLDVAIKGALLGWGLLWGVVFLGRVAFGKDAMGDGDVKMMRGVGALIGPLLLLANFGIAVVLGLVGGIVGILMARRIATPPEVTAEAGDEVYEATPLRLVLISGAIYLTCLDVVALFIPPLRRWLEGLFPAEMLEEEDDWKPSLTTIPFGPYLAAGALVCMLLGEPITKGMLDYWRSATGVDVAVGVRENALGRTPWALGTVHRTESREREAHRRVLGERIS